MGELDPGSGAWQHVVNPKLDDINNRPHSCVPPSLTPDMPVGNGSTWTCACGHRYRVNRNADHLSWVND